MVVYPCNCCIRCVCGLVGCLAWSVYQHLAAWSRGIYAKHEMPFVARNGGKKFSHFEFWKGRWHWCHASMHQHHLLNFNTCILLCMYYKVYGSIFNIVEVDHKFEVSKIRNRKCVCVCVGIGLKSIRHFETNQSAVMSVSVLYLIWP